MGNVFGSAELPAGTASKVTRLACQNAGFASDNNNNNNADCNPASAATCESGGFCGEKVSAEACKNGNFCPALTKDECNKKFPPPGWFRQQCENTYPVAGTANSVAVANIGPDMTGKPFCIARSNGNCPAFPDGTSTQGSNGSTAGVGLGGQFCCSGTQCKCVPSIPVVSKGPKKGQACQPRNGCCCPGGTQGSGMGAWCCAGDECDCEPAPL